MSEEHTAQTNVKALIEAAMPGPSKSEINEIFSSIKKEAHEFAATHVSSLPAQEANHDAFLHERLYRMIDYAITRFDWYEEQRNKFLQIGLAYFALAAGLSAFIATVIDKLPNSTKAFSLSALLSLVVTGFWVIYDFNRLISPTYPHRKISDIRSWFFIYNFTQDLPDLLSRNEEKAKKQVGQIGEAYKSFIKRWTEYAADRRKFIEEDLQQVFILQIMQVFRRKSLSRMKRVLQIGSFVFIILTAISIGTFLKYRNELPNPNQQRTTSDAGVTQPPAQGGETPR